MKVARRTLAATLLATLTIAAASVLGCTTHEITYVDTDATYTLDEAEAMAHGIRKPEFAGEIAVGFGRLDGKTVGFVANQPMVYSGSMTVDSSDKQTRFMRFCDCFNIPIITFVDVPGYLPGTRQEHGGVIRHGAKVIYAYSEATVPKLTVIVRKAYGGGYIAMGSRHLGADMVFAWPTAEIAVMGPEGAVEIVFKGELSKAKTPEEAKLILGQLVSDYRAKFANPYIAASRGYIDAVIEPKETRFYLIKALEHIATKREIQPKPPKKHGNIPV